MTEGDPVKLLCALAAGESDILRERYPDLSMGPVPE